jgi:hypothetical protein
MATRRYTPVALQTLNAALSSDFGLSWATKLFGEDAIASLPAYLRGPNKGKPKGFVIWRKALNGGYCREVCGPLAAGQMADAWIGLGPYSERGSVDGKWLGRTQALASSFSAGVFFEEGRSRQAAGI